MCIKPSIRKELSVAIFQYGLKTIEIVEEETINRCLEVCALNCFLSALVENIMERCTVNPLCLTSKNVALLHPKCICVLLI